MGSLSRGRPGLSSQLPAAVWHSLGGCGLWGTKSEDDVLFLSDKLSFPFIFLMFKNLLLDFLSHFLYATLR